MINSFAMNSWFVHCLISLHYDTGKLFPNLCTNVRTADAFISFSLAQLASKIMVVLTSWIFVPTIENGEELCIRLF